MRRLAVFAVLACVISLAACHPGAQAAKVSEDEGVAFLAKNAKAPGVVTLPDGLQYKVLQSGPAGGASPKRSDEIKVNYEGKLLSGQVFDSSWQRGEPMAGPLRALIPAWVEALQKMKPGDVWEIYVPARMGYGEQGQGPIPPNSVLIFKIELIGVLDSGESVGAG
jgi:FKBP-type peptidyl-prolyl cis-trans isomerase